MRPCGTAKAIASSRASWRSGQLYAYSFPEGRDVDGANQISRLGRAPHRAPQVDGQVGEYKSALDAGAMVNPAGVLDFLLGSLARHIHGMDKGYSSHLSAKGIH